MKDKPKNEQCSDKLSRRLWTELNSVADYLALMEGESIHSINEQQNNAVKCKGLEAVRAVYLTGLYQGAADVLEDLVLRLEKLLAKLIPEKQPALEKRNARRIEWRCRWGNGEGVGNGEAKA